MNYPDYLIKFASHTQVQQTWNIYLYIFNRDIFNWDGSLGSCGVSDGDLWWVFLLAQPNPQLSLEWELVRKTVSQKDISQKFLPADTQLAHTDTRAYTHTHLIHPFHSKRSPTQPGTPKHTHSLILYQFDMVLRLWWQYQLLAWLRWWRHRKDGGCHPMWVTGTWDVPWFINFYPEGEMRWQQSSSHAVYPFIGQCVYLTSSSWRSFVSSLCPPVCFSLSVFLSCLSHSLSHPLSFLFFLSWVMGGWILPFHPCGSHCIQGNNVRPINRVSWTCTQFTLTVGLICARVQVHVHKSHWQLLQMRQYCRYWLALSA